MYDIDLGTSSVKLLLLDTSAPNNIVAKTVSRFYKVSYPQSGWSEQSAADWWDALVDGMKELLQGIDPKQVSAISTAGQMHGLVALDNTGAVLRPVILWNDGRTIEEVRWLNQEIGEEKLLDATGNIAFAGFTAPKILWMEKHEPELFRRIAMILLPKDYITYRLTGVFATDYSDAAGTLLLDVEHKCFSESMLQLCHIKREQLPKLYESYEVVGNVTPEAASLLGLTTDVVVTAGAGDNAAAAIGTGCLKEGQCNLSLGTSGTIFLPSSSYRLDRIHATHSFCHATGEFHLMGCMLSAASCLKWWIEDICHSTDYDGLLGNISNDHLGKNHVFFLPYLMGERAPHNDPLARGTFIGMSANTTREDMTQAVLEGVAFAFRDMIESARDLGITIDRATLCGGGAKSQIWKEILANVLQVTLDELEEEQGPGLGAALLAGYGRGQYKNLEEAVSKTVRMVNRIPMQDSLVTLYNQRYQIFKELYPALKGIYPKL